jgi:hypothetical protein
MPKAAIRIGPSGIMIMKSSTWLNWMPASVSRKKRSARGESSVVMGRQWLGAGGKDTRVGRCLVSSDSQARLFRWLFGQPERSTHLSELRRLPKLGSA